MTDARTAIFAGPSAAGVRGRDGYVLFPPASAGDFDLAVRNGFGRIVYADALFFDAAPTHKEILSALAAGVEVFGVSSAGALRAVELESYGMIGFGVIYRLYRRGILTDDGELASVLSDHGYIADAPPLIQIRYYFGYLKEADVHRDVLLNAFSAISDCYFMVRDLNFIRSVLHTDVKTDFSTLLDITAPVFDIKANELTHLLHALKLGNTLSYPVSHPINMKWIRSGLEL